jgi:acyl-CoA synthetase (AMP-forming)/AMP-acid ligase II
MLIITIKKHFGEINNNIIDQISAKGQAGLILFSSGSTGKPKAMVHNLDDLILSYLYKRSKSLVFIVFLMFDHIGGLNTLLNCLSIGATIVIPKNRKPDEIANLIQEFKINVLPTSPTFLNLMLISKVHEIYDLKSLKMVTYGTEPMPGSLLRKLKLAFPWVKFLQTFGTSETGIIKTLSLASDSTFLKFDDPNQEFKIVNNELWLKSHNQILGYLNHENSSFTADGWFMTGDLVEEMDGGFIKIVGRLKEVINVGGEKVLPTEVESVIMEIPSIEDCIVKPEANSITGQMVVAEVVLKDGFVFREEKDKIKIYCKQKLDRYKVPARILQIDTIAFSERFKKNRG